MVKMGPYWSESLSMAGPRSDGELFIHMRLPRSGRAKGPGGNRSFLSLVVGFIWFLMSRARRRVMRGVRKTKVNIL